MKKIILVNLIVIIFLSFLIELFSIFYAANIHLKQLSDPSLLKRYKHGVVEFIVNSYTNKYSYYRYDVIMENFRPISGKNYTKRPVVLFGCSVTYGNLLNDDNNFSGILSKVAKRPVYNMAYDGWSPAHMLKLLKENRNKDLFFIENPEYVIYTIIKDHKRRLFFYQGWGYSTQLYLRYLIDKNGKLYPIQRKYPLYFKSFFVKNIQHSIENIKLKNEKLVDELLFKIFEESVSIIKSRWPNAKLIMLVYNDEMCSNDENVDIFKTEDVLTKTEQEKFKEMGFEIYNMEELVGKSLCGEEYHARCPIYGDVDHHHPSSKMWEEFVPKLVEKLGM